MEKIIKVLKEEIKNLSLEENINMSKLRELVNTYERLSGYVTTSVSQIPEQSEGHGFPTVTNYGAVNNVPARNEMSMFMDIIKDTLLRQNKSIPSIVGKNDIHDLIWLYKFFDEVESKSLLIGEKEKEKARNIRMKLYERISDLTEKKLSEHEEKEKEEVKLIEEIKENSLS